MKCPLPGYLEQEKIVSILSKIDFLTAAFATIAYNNFVFVFVAFAAIVVVRVFQQRFLPAVLRAH
jgi:hypothetical protein